MYGLEAINIELISCSEMTKIKKITPTSPNELYSLIEDILKKEQHFTKDIILVIYNFYRAAFTLSENYKLIQLKDDAKLIENEDDDVTIDTSTNIESYAYVDNKSNYLFLNGKYDNFIIECQIKFDMDKYEQLQQKFAPMPGNNLEELHDKYDKFYNIILSHRNVNGNLNWYLDVFFANNRNNVATLKFGFKHNGRSLSHKFDVKIDQLKDKWFMIRGYYSKNERIGLCVDDIMISRFVGGISPYIWGGNFIAVNKECLQIGGPAYVTNRWIFNGSITNIKIDSWNN